MAALLDDLGGWSGFFGFERGKQSESEEAEEKKKKKATTSERSGREKTLLLLPLFSRKRRFSSVSFTRTG